MYSYLKGEVVEQKSDGIILEVNDIGYKVLMANPYKFTKGEKTQIFTYFNVREDAQELYGFETEEVRELFLKLIKVNGVGPKSALAIIATDDLDGLINAIEQADVTYLTKFPKLGAKTASKVILELKGKLSVEATEGAQVFTANLQLEDALLALRALGYKDKEIKKAGKELAGEELGTDEYIKRALKLINKF